MNILQKIEKLEQIKQDIWDFESHELIQHSLEIDQTGYNLIIQLINKGNIKVCGAILQNGKLGYRCFDCSAQENHLFCQECFQIQKHKGHLAVIVYANGGSCDCGYETYLKKEAFCDRHQSNTKMEIIQLDEFVRDQYRQFIQISFALLFNKIEQIVDYPYQFYKQFNRAMEIIDESELFDQFKNQSNISTKYEQLREDISDLYTLIYEVLKEVTLDNICLSLLTSEFLQQSIDKEIQSVIQLHHNPDFKNQIKISSQQQLCNCSILELYVKFSGILSQVIPDQGRYFSDIFISLQIDEKFKPFLCRLIIQNFNHLYIPRVKYSFFTKEKDRFKIIINKLNYSENTYMSQLFQAISQNSKIDKIKFSNHFLYSELFKYFYQIEGQIIYESIKLQNQINSNSFISFFKIFSKMMLELLLCKGSVCGISKKINDLLLSFFTTEASKNCFQQIVEIIESQDEQFLFEKVSPSSKIFQTLQKNSLFIYFLTRAYPSSISTQTNNKLNSHYYFPYSQDIQINTLRSFRIVFFFLVKNWQDHFKNQYTGLNNIMRIILNYLFKKQQNVFNIQPQQKLRSLLKNQILSDRNMILVLSRYLESFNDSNEWEKFNLIQRRNVQHAEKNSIKLYQIFQIVGDIELYNGQVKRYIEGENYCDVALEQVDVAFVQIYAFIFGTDGLNDIITQFQTIGSELDLPIDASRLILRISQSDNDLIQCQGIHQGDLLTEQSVKGLNKLFQTIFFAQTFYNSKALISLLKQLSYDTNFDIKNCIISSCELNPDNDKLQLKKSLLPAQYEPVFAQQIPSLKDEIDDKLKTQGDYFQYFFGSSLANELSNEKSTRTFKRFAILKAIAQDDKQIILKDFINIIKLNYKQIDQQPQNLKQITTLLEEKAVYINLLFQSNKALGPNKVIQDGLQQLLTINYEIVQKYKIQNVSSVFCNCIILLDESSILDFKLSNDDQLQKIKQKKQQLHDKFKCMSTRYQESINQEIQPQGDDEDLCSFCKFNFKENEFKSKVLLIQFTNQLSYQKLIHLENSKTNNILQIDISFCGHIFHEKCLKQNEDWFDFGESSYYKCQLCSMPYNFVFLNPFGFNSFQNKKLQENFDNYFQIISNDIYLKYFDKYKSENEFQIFQAVNDFYTCCVSNLLMKLLGNTQDFYQKKQHQLLQEMIYTLRLLYQETQQSILDLANLNTNEILFGILDAIQKFLISSDSLKEFKLYLNTILDQNQQQVVFDLITKQKVDEKVQSFQIYNQKQYKTKIKTQYLEFFQQDFRQFLVKNNLAPCKKKLCKFQLQSRLEDEWSEQYICLICFKKMCSLHCGRQSKSEGNLTRHAKKKHNSKSIYLHITSSQILIFVTPYVLYCDQTLYQDLISQQPVVGTYGSSYYEDFKLNQKAIDMIVDVILEEKYLHKMFANRSKAQVSQI